MASLNSCSHGDVFLLLSSIIINSLATAGSIFLVITFIKALQSKINSDKQIKIALVMLLPIIISTSMILGSISQVLVGVGCIVSNSVTVIIFDGLWQISYHCALVANIILVGGRYTQIFGSSVYHSSSVEFTIRLMAAFIIFCVFYSILCVFINNAFFADTIGSTIMYCAFTIVYSIEQCLLAYPMMVLNVDTAKSKSDNFMDDTTTNIHNNINRDMFNERLIKTLTKMLVLGFFTLVWSIVINSFIIAGKFTFKNNYYVFISILFSFYTFAVILLTQWQYMFWYNDKYGQCCFLCHRIFTEFVLSATETVAHLPNSRVNTFVPGALPGAVESNANQFIDQLRMSRNFISQFEPSESNNDINNNNNSSNTMESIVLTVINLIENQMNVSQDLLVLSICYCHRMSNRELHIKLINSLKNITNKCLDNCNNDNKNYRKWFKKYLLSSNIWLFPQKDDLAMEFEGKDNDKREDKNKKERKLWFDMIDEQIDSTLYIQKEMIHDSIVYEKDNYFAEWNELIMFENKIDEKKHIIKLTNSGMRQDDPKIGILPQYSSYQLNEIRGENNYDIRLVSFVDDDSYDTLDEYNIKSYLTQCIIIAHALNDTFQKDMKNLFENLNIEKLKFQSAPIKQEARCIIKANTDYLHEKFPSVANICDFVRCAITVDHCTDLLNALNMFLDKIKKKQCGCVIGIVKMKNGFKQANTWNLTINNKKLGENENENKDDNKDDNNKNEFEYFDIKLNVIIELSKSTINNKKNGKIRMIGEIQFLLNQILESKKYSHFGYSIRRKHDYFGAVFKKANRKQDISSFLRTM